MEHYLHPNNPVMKWRRKDYVTVILISVVVATSDA